MGIGKWILHLRDGLAKALINTLAATIIFGIGSALTFIFISAKIGATTGQEQKKLSAEVQQIKSKQDTTQLRQQKVLDIMLQELDSLSESVKDLHGDLEVIDDKLVEIRQDGRQRDADIKELFKSIK